MATQDAADTPAPGTDGDAAREAAVETALAKLDLDAKARLLAGQDTWSLPALPQIGLRSLVMSDGPVGVRGVRWTAADPSVVLPSPTALAATWDPALARRAGRLLAQEARRKGVHALLAPTVNLHRSPLGGRHFECYSEDPYLTTRIGTGYVRGVQDGGVGTTLKHFVGNDAETERFTVNNTIPPRALRELYLAPFEAIVRDASPWGVMSAYNGVNGSTMTQHASLQLGVLRGEWGYDGVIVSDWMATRDTTRALNGGLDVAMPGPRTVYGQALATAVREGRAEECAVDAAVRNVLRLAARTGVLDAAPPAVAPADLPATVDGDALAREIAHRSFVLVRNERGTLPIDPAGVSSVAVIGAAARDARILGGGSAEVFPAHIVSPLDGLRAALPESVAVHHAVGADPSDEPAVAGQGFELRAVCRDVSGRQLGSEPLPSGLVQWLGDFPDGVSFEDLHTVEITGTFTARESGVHAFGTRGLGGLALTVGGRLLFEGIEEPADEGDPFEAFQGTAVPRGEVELTAGESVEVSLICTVAKLPEAPMSAVACALVHRDPVRDPEALMEEAVAAASVADTAVVVVATTERVESEGFDRTSLALPGRQDELVRRVAAVAPRTVVVVNSGSPVELPWRDEVDAVLLGWFPGQEAGAALADVLLGDEEPGGRLPTTWPVALTDAPVTQVEPDDGELVYEEGVFIGYRAWEKTGRTPAYPFGHGLGYTTWDYDSLDLSTTDATATVRLRNTGTRHGREVVQIYLAPGSGGPGLPERPARWLAGFATVEAAPGETVSADIPLPRRAFEIWDEKTDAWRLISGTYVVEAAHSIADRRLRARLHVER
ncbi:glycoside hydrolase family 3 C-terminal domain-containing protein [Streptomyces sp. NPDC051776]|uniref:glycoside hydrolase family 3 protein n=1 Tax=Streptomyces sp. NPDC051776 TaxID=3155414 RepID=UPI00343830B1